MILRTLCQSPTEDVNFTRGTTPALEDRFIALTRQLAARIAQEANQPKPPETKLPLRVFLLFERWRDNALAAEFDQHHSQHARKRQSVPDDFYKGREDEAPCVVELPPAIWPPVECASLPDAFAQDWWVAWLEQVWLQAHKRLTRQDFAAALLTRASTGELARHLARLGRQRPPDGAKVRLFRHQDPRVMQRVWPALNAQQRRLWLGPVLAWWTPAHPWGPWSPGLLGEDALPGDPPPQWFEAEPPAPEQIDADIHIYRSALFDARQWALAHSAPIGNQVWRRCAMDGIEATEQPDGKTVDRLIAEGQTLGLSDENLEDFILHGWLGRWTEPATGQSRSAWQSPQGEQALRHALDALAQQPQAKLTMLLREAGFLPRRQTRPAPIPTAKNPQGAAHGL